MQLAIYLSILFYIGTIRNAAEAHVEECDVICAAKMKGRKSSRGMCQCGRHKVLHTYIYKIQICALHHMVTS
jgi:hypothetical protein